MLLVKVEDKTERGIQPNDSFVKQVKEQLNEYGKLRMTTWLPLFRIKESMITD